MERHTCCDTFYDMCELLCECLEAVLNPFEYRDMNGRWDEETMTKAQGLLTSLTSSHTIIADRPNQGTNGNDETRDRRGV